MGDDAAKKGLSLPEERELTRQLKYIHSKGRLQEYLEAVGVAKALRTKIEAGFQKRRKIQNAQLQEVPGIGAKTASLLCHKEATDLTASLMVEEIKEAAAKAEAEIKESAAKAAADRDALVARKKAAREKREEEKAMEADVERLVEALRTSTAWVASAALEDLPGVIKKALVQGQALAGFIADTPGEDDAILAAALKSAGAQEAHTALEEAMATAWAAVDKADAEEEEKAKAEARQKRKKREKVRSDLARHPKADRIRYVLEGVFSRSPSDAAQFLHAEGFSPRLKPDRLARQLTGAWNAQSSSWTREADSLLGWGLRLPEDLVKEVRVNTPAPLTQSLPLARIKIPAEQDWINEWAEALAADVAALPPATIKRILALQA
jgi:hypothetical protein